MTTSGSIPFSLASASIVCCNGFDIFDLTCFSRGPIPARQRPRAQAYPQLTYPACPTYPPQSKFHFQVRARDHLKRHAVPATIVGIDQNDVGVDSGQLPLEEGLAVDLLTHHDLRSTPCKAPVVVR